MPRLNRGCVLLLGVLVSACDSGTSTAPSPTFTAPTPAPTRAPTPAPVVDPDVSINAVSPTGFDVLSLSWVSVTGQWARSATDLKDRSNLAATTVTYTARLSPGTYGIGFDPIRSDSSESSISFGGAELAGNTGGVLPGSIRTVYVLGDAKHVTVNRCSVTVPSDVWEIDVTFSVVLADVTQVC